MPRWRPRRRRRCSAGAAALLCGALLGSLVLAPLQGRDVLAFLGRAAPRRVRVQPQQRPNRCLRRALPRSRGGVLRLEYASGRYRKWVWRSHVVNYLRRGPLDGRAVVLVHGFGGSAYHWRHNVPALAAAGFNVYAFDLLGFGRSDKPLVEYGAGLWADQLLAFIDEVVRAPAAVVGNSIGGYVALRAAGGRPDLVGALALLNAAGPFSDDDPDARLQRQLASGGEQTLLALGQLAATSAPLPAGARELLQRGFVSGAFLVLRTPARVRQILELLYPASAENVDDELISSILLPAYHPNASEVYFRIVAGPAQRSLSGDDLVDALCQRLERPLLLLWGQQDPWVQLAVADKIERAYRGPECRRVELAAGHCPMDEAPAQVNEALLQWLSASPCPERANV